MICEEGSETLWTLGAISSIGIWKSKFTETTFCFAIVIPEKRLRSVRLGTEGKTMAELKCAWYAEYEGVCINADCPMCADYCPVPDIEGVCRFEERGAHERVIADRN